MRSVMNRANVQAAAWVQDGVTLVLLTPTLLLLVTELGRVSPRRSRDRAATMEGTEVQQ